MQLPPLAITNLLSESQTLSQLSQVSLALIQTSSRVWSSAQLLDFLPTSSHKAQQSNLFHLNLLSLLHMRYDVTIGTLGGGPIHRGAHCHLLDGKPSI